MIPKTIHYCWFGKGVKSSRIRSCIASWKKILPGYELKEWNESNFDVNFNSYVQEAYCVKKWAYVSDVARLYALYQEGGIYLDTDVEVIRPLDEFLHLHAFIGRESANGSGTGVIGSIAGGRFVKEMLDDYHNRHFVLPDGSLNYKTNVEYMDDRMKRLGMKIQDAEFAIPNYVKVFKQEVFCPKSWQTGVFNVTENTHAIHHFTTTYNPPWRTRRIRILNWIRGYCGERVWRIADLLWMNPFKSIKRIISYVVRKAGIQK